ncbi:hypothetical protein DFJ73DRAFT_104179 [Zopfochytrium polystomum]|nr:hypothetical protein DFJ73DRAFT_104179 [Zopfochytrium polystomum]
MRSGSAARRPSDLSPVEQQQRQPHLGINEEEFEFIEGDEDSDANPDGEMQVPPANSGGASLPSQVIKHVRTLDEWRDDPDSEQIPEDVDALIDVLDNYLRRRSKYSRAISGTVSTLLTNNPAPLFADVVPSALPRSGPYQQHRVSLQNPAESFSPNNASNGQQVHPHSGKHHDQWNGFPKSESPPRPAKPSSTKDADTEDDETPLATIQTLRRRKMVS